MTAGANRGDRYRKPGERRTKDAEIRPLEKRGVARQLPLGRRRGVKPWSSARMNSK